MIAFYVQGGGLGHLTRTHKLIQYLKIDAKEVLIISPSAFKHYFKQYEFCAISWESDPAIWSKTIIQLLTKYGIQHCYVDVFPLGIKGELIPVYKALPKTEFIYICRILKWEKYLSDMPSETFIPSFTKTIVLENLYKEHFNWVKTATNEIDHIKLPTKEPKKHIKLIKEPYVLVIHSGGKKDVLDLCTRVKADMTHSSNPIFIFTQVSVSFDDERFHFRVNEYPVQQYIKHAFKVYTAAGFNLVNELSYYQKKHTIFPIDRLYDDQFFRTQNSATLLLK